MIFIMWLSYFNPGGKTDYFTSAIDTIGSTRGINKLQSLFLSTPKCSNINVKIKKIKNWFNKIIVVPIMEYHIRVRALYFNMGNIHDYASNWNE